MYQKLEDRLWNSEIDPRGKFRVWVLSLHDTEQWLNIHRIQRAIGSQRLDFMSDLQI